MASINVIDCNVVLEVEGSGALLQYPASLDVKLLEGPYGPTKPSDPAKRKRCKKTRALNAGEKHQRDYHLQVRERLMKCYSNIIEAAKSVHYFPVLQSSNTGAPSCTCSDIDFASMCSLALLVPTMEPAVILKNDADCHDCNDVFGKVISNVSDKGLSINVLGKRFLVPPRSSFLLSDLSQITPLYEYTSMAGLFDVIVVDPPWENRSAIRGKKYAWLPSERLHDVSLPRLAAVGAVVAVWVTNKRKLATFVRHSLFPKWHVHYLTEWHWLKVTTSGDLIHDMDSVHKKPYEIVVIGQYAGSGERTEDMETAKTPMPCSIEHQDTCDEPPSPKQLCLETSLVTATCSEHESNTPSKVTGYSKAKDEPSRQQDNTEHYSRSNDVAVKSRSHVGDSDPTCTSSCPSNKPSDTDYIEKCKPFEHQVFQELCQPFVFMCVASQMHSQKPFLGDMLTKYCKKDGRKLELFARNLLPDWTSWGNEVLRFQEQVKPPVTSVT